ncbi:MAG: hypothetical protein LBV34_07285 [Nocardiopsaceae bacterium]|nr:hypothetical protein [Nocardiopsaceae bacterium]
MPGVYLVHDAGLTAGQREAAAVLYAGQGSVITGAAALARMAMRVPIPDVVDVLVPHQHRRASRGFVRILRTRRMPEHVWMTDRLPWAPAARSVADAARLSDEADYVRALVAGAVQQDKCTVQQLAAELNAGPKRGSAALRAALEEVADGVRSIAEGDLRKLIKSGGLPKPLFNPDLFAGKTFLARPDAWWGKSGVAVEVDSREWHLSPADWERTQARHALMSAHGILVLHYSPRRIRADGPAILGEIRSTLEAGRKRQPLPIRAVPAT